MMQKPDQINWIEVEEMPRIILAVSDAKRRAAYLSAMGHAAVLTLTDRIGEIPKLLRQAPCCGILIDITLKIRASHMDKVRIADFIQMMPSASLNMDPKRGSILILMLNQSFGTARTITEFISLSAGFHPPPIYPQDLCTLRLNAIIAKSPDFGGMAEKTITMFISGRGCFLFTANPETYEPGSAVWIDFVGISNRSPVKGRVCWQCPWGISHKVSGINVEFESILEEQFDEIASLVARDRNKNLF